MTENILLSLFSLKISHFFHNNWSLAFSTSRRLARAASAVFYVLWHATVGKDKSFTSIMTSIRPYVFMYVELSLSLRMSPSQQSTRVCWLQMRCAARISELRSHLAMCWQLRAVRVVGVMQIAPAPAPETGWGMLPKVENTPITSTTSGRCHASREHWPGLRWPCETCRNTSPATAVCLPVLLLIDVASCL